jgi:TonB family protein
MGRVILLLFLCVQLANAQDDLSSREASGEEDDNIEVYYTFVKVKPLFMNDSTDRLFVEYIGENVNYPKQCILNKNEGTVYLEFVIMETGEVEHVKVLRSSSHALLDQEALRVLRQCPNWTPGKNEKGENVRVKKVIPIRFRL